MDKTTAKEKKIDVSGKYFYAVGRRKSATATVRLYEKGTGKIYVNGIDLKNYFPRFEHQQIITDPLKSVGAAESHDITIHVMGGGKKGQADSIKLGISRALTIMDAELRDTLKKNGYLSRDPRKKERKKPGLKGARRAPQWSKR